MRTIAALVLTATLTAGAVPAVAGTAEPSTLQQDLAQLLDGVHEIAAPGAPGNLVVFGDAAFPVVVGRSGRSGRGVVVSAGRFGKGRVVAFSHNGYFGNEALAVGDTSRFMANAVRWAAGGRAATTPKLRVGLYRERDLVEFFEDNGFKAAEADLHRLNALQVLVANAHSFSEKDIEPLTKFVQSGGGLVTGSCGWGWAQLNPAKDLRCDFAGNRLLAPMGMVWGSGTLERTGPRGFAAGETPPRTLHAGWASQSALAQIEGRSVLSAADSDQASATITAAARALPPDDKVFLPKLGQLARSDKTPVMPTPGAPIKKSDLAARLAATFQAMTAKMLPPEQVKAHPVARIFPGEVPAGAPRSTRKLDMDTRVP
ncbi:MAG: hypothetical protein FJ388_22985, partial [Verrucomicrobia bacterium]|nr:hypothetical protein [Verrucomicrobiota bacterium]